MGSDQLPSPVDAIQPPIAVAILAAGRGARLAGGTSKPLLMVAGRSLLDRALDAAVASGARRVLVIAGEHIETIRRAVSARSDSGIVVVASPQWSRGIAHSLHAAIDALEARTDIEAVCVGLADQPLVGAGSYRNLIAAYHDGATFAVATYRGERANPVLLGREIWSEARELSGDEGARALMRHHPVVEVPCDGTGDPTDVDTISDLEALEQRCASKTPSE